MGWVVGSSEQPSGLEGRLSGPRGQPPVCPFPDDHLQERDDREAYAMSGIAPARGRTGEDAANSAEWLFRPGEYAANLEGYAVYPRDYTAYPQVYAVYPKVYTASTSE